MFAVKPLSSLKSDLSGASFRRPPSLPGLGAKIRRTRRPKENGGGSIRAVISSGDQVVETEKAPAVEGNGSPPYSSSNSNTVDLKVVLTVRKKIRQRLSDKIEAQFESLINGIGRGISLQLVGEEIDPDTQSGKMAESAVRGWLPQQPEQPYIVEYAADFTVAKDFGPVGAVLVTNLQGKEFYLVEIVINGFEQGPIYFPAHTWIHAQKHNRESRIIFRNQVYLPSQTPPGLKDLRREDLASIRGDGQGERKAHERIYDYAPYNDLGNPDKGEELVRPVLGTDEKPYPRRCRTGRPPMRTDKRCESRIEKPHPVYVPRDETFEEIKQATFAAGRLKALLHNLVPLISSSISTSEVSFKCFSEIDRLYTDGLVLSSENDQNNNGPILPSVFKEFLTEGTRLMKYKIPAIISRDRFAWLRDNEFARQALAGLNPVSIELLKEFPIMSKLDPAVYGPPESALTKEVLEKELDGMSVEEAIEEKRLFIIDYHDMILPFVEKINAIPNRKVYASRTIFFYNRTGFLRPIAIELTLPPTYSSPQNKRIITHGKSNTSHWTWKLAKAHVCSVDAGVHQLVNHWLRTHASMEPYIIATHRQLSAIHPVYKLLRPHMRYTLEINALARQSLINGGGVIEACFSPGKYAMELSSAAYKSKWRFDMEALPADLIRRGVAVEDPTAPHGLRLLIEDYPYAADGLLVWSATKEWVESYVGHFYSEPGSIASDVELHGWWDEIKNKGHYDKRNEPWWPELNTKEDLTSILTTIIWTGSGQHAAINFGQYPFGGYMPNRPTLMRRLIPEKGTTEYDTFIMNPQLTFLLSLPTQVQATKVMAVQETLSTHSGDEEYLGQVNPMQKHWINDREVVHLFEKFSDKLMEIEKIIHDRNRDLNLSNRSGAGVPPYELLLPSSGPGVTGRGIPNSISI